jgi:O-methyltransferase
MELYEKVQAFTLCEIERCYALYQSTNYILRNNIQGDLVECGVWQGGSAMLMGYMLAEAKKSDRSIWLYDTFEGMTKPGEGDDESAKKHWEKMQNADGTNQWCYASLDDVRQNLKRTGYPENMIHLIKGKVEDTIPAKMPEKISLLRLDTDWYVSTQHELQHLFPLIEKGGALLIDDYGAWKGAQKAVDEYFKDKPIQLISRIDFTGRLIIRQ